MQKHHWKNAGRYAFFVLLISGWCALVFFVHQNAAALREVFS